MICSIARIYLRAVPGNSFSLEGFHLLGSNTAKPSPLYGTNPVVLVALHIRIPVSFPPPKGNCMIWGSKLPSTQRQLHDLGDKGTHDYVTPSIALQKTDIKGNPETIWKSLFLEVRTTFQDAESRRREYDGKMR